MYVWVPEVGNTADIGYYPFKGNLGVPTGQWKFDHGGVWTHDLRMLYRLSYEASTGAGRGNLGSESR